MGRSSHPVWSTAVSGQTEHRTGGIPTFDALVGEITGPAAALLLLGMAHYSPTQRDRLLEHSLRRRIVDLINARPGISKGRLRRSVECSWGTIHHHLALLTREGFVKAERAGRRLRYFPAEMNNALLESVVLIRQGRAMDIVNTVVENSGHNQTELLATISMSRKVLRPHIDRLIDAGLIEEVRDNGCCRYHPTPRLEMVMEHINVQEDTASSTLNGDGLIGRKFDDLNRP